VSGVALVLVAHGSRREASNAEVRALAATLAARAEGQFSSVHAGFLELAEPSIPEAIAAAIAAGAREVRVLPWFLSAGRHVSEDIPAQVAEARARHPGVPIHLLGHAGALPGMAEILLAAAGGGGG